MKTLLFQIASRHVYTNRKIKTTIISFIKFNVSAYNFCHHQENWYNLTLNKFKHSFVFTKKLLQICQWRISRVAKKKPDISSLSRVQKTQQSSQDTLKEERVHAVVQCRVFFPISSLLLDADEMSVKLLYGEKESGLWSEQALGWPNGEMNWSLIPISWRFFLLFFIVQYLPFTYITVIAFFFCEFKVVVEFVQCWIPSVFLTIAKVVCRKVKFYK